MSTRGMGRAYLRGNVWWIAYYHAGQKIRESSGSTLKKHAVALLKRRHEEMGKGRPAHEADKVTLADLRALIEGDYRLQGRRSGRRMRESWNHLEAFFGEREKVLAITPPRLAAYVTLRTDEGAAAGTVKTELSALKRAFNLARKAGVLLPNEVPAAFPTIAASRPRPGFFERPEHEAVKAALPADCADVAEFLFWSGWRKGEALGLRWSNVDMKAQVIRIETTKSGEPRTLPYGSLPVLAELVKRRRELADEAQKKRGMVVSHVFTRNGEPIRHFRRAWISACIAAGLGREERAPDVKDEAGNVVKRGKVIARKAFRIPHDYRRSAARNLSRAGVPERVIMQLCGWKTRSVFDRYRIVSESELSEGLAKLADPAAEAPEPAKVATIASGKKRARRRG
jgi:integrase